VDAHNTSEGNPAQTRCRLSCGFISQPRQFDSSCGMDKYPSCMSAIIPWLDIGRDASTRNIAWCIA
jgi:hypothetical protein